MNDCNYAYFVKRPRTINDLCRPHRPEEERPFEVAKVIRLAAIDYENFITDMLADRQFIEDNALLCEQEDTWRCLLVCRQGSSDGVLVMPVERCFVGWAGYCGHIDLSSRGGIKRSCGQFKGQEDGCIG